MLLINENLSCAQLRFSVFYGVSNILLIRKVAHFDKKTVKITLSSNTT